MPYPKIPQNRSDHLAIELPESPLGTEPQNFRWLIGVVDDNRLRFKENTFVVEPDPLILNGLLKLRDRWASSAEIQDAGGIAIGYSGFIERISALRNNIGALIGAEEEILSADGPPRTRKYRLSSEIAFIDERGKPDSLRYKFGITSEIPSYDDYDGQRLVFKSLEDRRRLFSAMCRQRLSTEQTQQVGLSILKGKKVRELYELMPQFSTEELLQACKEIEEGMVAFLQPEQDTRTYTASARAITAYQRILLTTVPQVKRLSVVSGLRYGGSYDDELFQEGCFQAIKETLDLGGRENYEKACEFFYEKCNKSILYSMWAASRKRLQDEKTISEREYDLMRQISVAFDDLMPKLQREPSPAEIAKHIGAPEENVAYNMMKLEAGGVSIDIFEAGDVLSINGFHDTIDKEINLAYQQHIISTLFLSNDLTDNEKIAMSLSFSIYSSALCGATFSTRMRREPFVYPYTEEDFAAIVRESDSLEALSGVIKYSVDRLRPLLKGALRKSHQLLSHTWSFEDIYN